MPTKLFYIAISISIILHGLIFLRPYKKVPHQAETTPQQSIELLLGKKELTSKDHKAVTKNTSMRKNSAGNLQNLYPSPYWVHNRTNSNTSHTKPSLIEQEGDVLETMNQMSLSEYSNNSTFFEILKNRIDEFVTYPQNFVEHNIQGEQKITILINHKGELLQIINSTTGNPVLKTYLILNIYTALKQPFPKKYWYTPERTLTISLNFDYQIFTFGNQLSRQESQNHKNHFKFLRVKNGPDVVNDFLLQNARYIPPIIPIPGGFIISFTQIYNLVNAWSELDPKVRREQNLELTKKKLDLMVLKARKKHLNKD